jgi:hypothetical protein
MATDLERKNRKILCNYELEADVRCDCGHEHVHTYPCRRIAVAVIFMGDYDDPPASFCRACLGEFLKRDGANWIDGVVPVTRVRFRNGRWQIRWTNHDKGWHDAWEPTPEEIAQFEKEEAAKGARI